MWKYRKESNEMVLFLNVFIKEHPCTLKLTFLNEIKCSEWNGVRVFLDENAKRQTMNAHNLSMQMYQSWT
jgi:hypothetical protein